MTAGELDNVGPRHSRHINIFSDLKENVTYLQSLASKHSETHLNFGALSFIWPTLFFSVNPVPSVVK